MVPLIYSERWNLTVIISQDFCGLNSMIKLWAKWSVPARNDLTEVLMGSSWGTQWGFCMRFSYSSWGFTQKTHAFVQILMRFCKIYVRKIQNLMRFWETSWVLGTFSHMRILSIWGFRTLSFFSMSLSMRFWCHISNIFNRMYIIKYRLFLYAICFNE